MPSTIHISSRVGVRLSADLDVVLSATSDAGLFVSTSSAVLVLTPEDAATVGRQLVEAAETAVHESRARRRV